MNKQDKTNVAHTANDILWLWREVIQEADRNEPDEARRCWYKHGVRQAYQDTLQAMKRHGLIEDYDVVKVAVKIDGNWDASRYQPKFKPRGKAIPV